MAEMQKHRVFLQGKPVEVEAPATATDEELIALAMRKVGQPPEQAGLFARAHEAAMGPTRNVMRFFSDVATGQLATTPGRGVTAGPTPELRAPFESPAAEMAARIINPVPASPTEAAITLATAGAGPIAKAAGLTRLPGVIARAGIPAITAFGAERLQGATPGEAGVSAAVTGGTLGLFEAGGGLYRAMRTFLQGATTAKRVRDIIARDTPKFVEAVGREVPALRGLLNPERPQTLQRFAEHGDEALAAVFQRADTQIAAAFPSQDLSAQLSILARSRGPRAGRLPLSIEGAQDLLKRLKQEARKADPGPAGFQLREMTRAAEDQYRGLLGSSAPALRQVYDTAVQQFDRGKRLLGVVEDLHKNAAITADERGIAVNFADVADHLMRNARELRGAFPHIEESVTRATQNLARDVQARMFQGRLGTRMPLPGQPFAAASPGGMPLFRTAGVEPHVGLPQEWINLLALLGTRQARPEAVESLRRGGVPGGR